MFENYKNHINKLLQESLFREEDIYFIDGVPNEPEFLELFTYYSKALIIENKYYDFEPFFLFFKNDISVNAIAGKNEKVFFLGINSGLIMHLIINVRNKTFKINEELIPTSFIKNLDTNLNMILYQFCIHFTFYHELGHLIQFSCKKEEKRNFNINYQEDIKKEFNLRNHFLEIDADEYSSLCLANHVMNYVENNLDNTIENYIFMTKLCISSIMMYIQSFFNINQEFYLRKNSHPHPVIRIINAASVVKAYIINALKLKGMEIEKEQFDFIFDSIIIASQMPINRFNPNNYKQILLENRNDIENYLKEVKKYNSKCSAVNRRNESLLNN
ncbi:hypothetical protein [Aureivirga marina]|uniref:hypothetical protein n=1 Tax=Aureivirga marina TaxID=1182451 RepID=UPI0018CB788E|nr:hypothetical protein [Aureivirga marina]